MTQKFNDLEKRFSVRSENFQQEFQHLKDPEKAFGIRFTAIPVDDEVRLDCVFCNGTIAEQFKELQPRVFIQEGDHNKRLLKDEGTFSSLRWWSIPNGGARQTSAVGDTKFSVHSYRELHRDGLIEMGFVSDSRDSDYEGILRLLPDLPIFVFANLVVWADQIRNYMSASTAEYIIQMEIRTGASHVIVADNYTPLAFARRTGTVFPPGMKKFLRYSLGNSEEIQELIALFYHDFCSFFGKYTGIEKAVFTVED